MVSVQQMTAAELAAHAEPDTDAGIGALQTERGNLPLESIDVTAAITGLAVRTELTQGFRNPYDEPLEATYIFPLPDRAAVTALSMRAAGRVVDGVLRERGAARAEYQQAIAHGQRAAIVEEERPGVFTMRVGNIAPGEQVAIHLVLAGVLPFDDGTATFRFPLVVAPRFIPGTLLNSAPVGDGTWPDTDAVPDASRITPPVLLPGFPNPIRLSAQVDIDPAGLLLAELTASMPVRADADNPLRLFLEPGERANQDFVLRLRLGDPDALRASCTVRPDDDPEAGGTFALTLLPPTDSGSTRPRDVVLLLDRSGSMSGWKMVAARRAAARIVDTLTETDTLAVLAFDHQIDTPPQLPKGLVPATDRNRFRAVEHLAGMTARGGTQLLEPLREAIDLLRGQNASASAEGRERAVVLVTDGQVGNEDQILHTLGPLLAGIRVHTVGVDTAVNEAFLRRLSALAGGRCELVESEDRLDAAMRAIHRRIATPLVTDLRISAAGLALDEASVAPQPIPDLFPGAPILLTGRFDAEGSVPSDGATVTVTGKALGGNEWSQTLTAKPSANAALSSVWARARVRDLEDRYVSGQFGGADTGLAELEQEIIRVSLAYQVLCRFTAFVAVDSRVVDTGAEPKQVMQPVDLPAGWEMSAPQAPLQRSPLRFAAPAAFSAAEASRGLSFTSGGPAIAVSGTADLTRSSQLSGPELGTPELASPELPSGESAPIAPAPAQHREKSGGRGRAKAKQSTVSRQVQYGAAVMRPAAPQLPPLPPVPGSVREFASRALRRLRELADQSMTDRIGALADVADELAKSIAGFVADGLAEPESTLLRTFAGELARPVADQVELERRWLYAVDVLEPLAGEEPADHVSPAGQEGPATRADERPFWKR